MDKTYLELREGAIFRKYQMQVVKTYLFQI